MGALAPDEKRSKKLKKLSKTLLTNEEKSGIMSKLSKNGREKNRLRRGAWLVPWESEKKIEKFSKNFSKRY